MGRRPEGGCVAGSSAVPEHYPKILLCECHAVAMLFTKTSLLGNYSHGERKEQQWQARRGVSKKQRNDERV